MRWRAVSPWAMPRKPRNIVRPARRLVVSGPVSRAVDTVIASFVAEKFRLASLPGEYPVVLECGSRTLPYLLASLWFVPGKVGENSRFGQVQISVSEASATATAAITIALTDAILGSSVVPLVLRAMDNAIERLDAAEVLITLGPVVSA